MSIYYDDLVKEYEAKIISVENKLDIATKALEFYATDDIHQYEFDAIDFPMTAKKALSKIRGENA